MSLKKPLEDKKRDRLRRLRDEKGLYQAAGLVGCSRQTFERALGGLDLNPGTVALLDAAFAQRDRDNRNP
jgi:hypothetical protein